jgi:Ca2+-binding RTX toxin-like protein
MPDGVSPKGVIYGSNLGETLYGTAEGDVIYALGGDDVVHAGAGSDRAEGGDGNDQLFGEDGNDRLLGGPGDDRIRGGPGDDWLEGGGGKDHFLFLCLQPEFSLPGDGTDVVNGGGDFDTAQFTSYVGRTPFTVSSSSLQEVVVSYHGGMATLVEVERLEFATYFRGALVVGDLSGTSVKELSLSIFGGGASVDLSLMGAGIATQIRTENGVSPQEGDDVVTGSAGPDVIFVGSGRDAVRGGGGADQITVQGGRDTLVFAPGEAQGDDIVGFFNPAWVDAALTGYGSVLEFRGFGAGRLVNAGGDYWTVFAEGAAAGETFRLRAVTALAAETDYVFV